MKTFQTQRSNPILRYTFRSYPSNKQGRNAQLRLRKKFVSKIKTFHTRAFLNSISEIRKVFKTKRIQLNVIFDLTIFKQSSKPSFIQCISRKTIEGGGVWLEGGGVMYDCPDTIIKQNKISQRIYNREILAIGTTNMASLQPGIIVYPS